MAGGWGEGGRAGPAGGRRRLHRSEGLRLGSDGEGRGGGRMQRLGKEGKEEALVPWA